MCKLRKYILDTNISSCHSGLLQGCYVIVTWIPSTVFLSTPCQRNIHLILSAFLGSVGKFERIPENVKMRLLYDDFGNGSSPSAYYSTRPGKATRTHRCGTVDHRIPSHLTFITRLVQGAPLRGLLLDAV